MTRSKQIGTWAETEVVKAFQRADIRAVRPALRGMLDHGDVWAADGAIVVEVKAGEQTRKPSWNKLAQWWAETEREAARVPECDVSLLVTRRWGSGKAEDWTAYLDAPTLPWLALGGYVNPSEAPAWPPEPVAIRFGALLPLLAARYVTQSGQEETG